MEIDYEAFDADNHYYEALDAFTRHLDPAWGPRVVQWCEIDGRKYHVVGGRVSRAVTNPTFDPIAPPGALHDYFRGNPDGKTPMDFLRDREPIPAEYRDRAARLAVMDEHGLESIWLFPTLGVLYEEPLKHDPAAVMKMVQAFNRWLEEDWGFHHQERIFAAPMLSLADPEAAVADVESLLARGVRIVHVRPAPVPGPNGTSRSLGDKAHDAVFDNSKIRAIVPGFAAEIPFATGAGQIFTWYDAHPTAQIVDPEFDALLDRLAANA